MNNSDTKILFTDLDETLLTSDKDISKENLDQIEKMVSAGHKFVVATGRPFYSANKLCQEYGFIRPGFYLVCSNGGVIYDYDTNSYIEKLTVPYEYVSYVFAKAKEFGLHIHTYMDDFVLSERETDELRFYCSRIKMPYRILSKIPDDLSYEPPKMIAISLEGRQNLIPFRDSLYPWIEGKLNTIFSSEYLLEMLPPGAEKGNAVAALCRHYNIPICNSIACGDEENDISMIKVAGIGVAMQNAKDSVKSCADYITSRTNNEHAIAEVIDRFIL